MANPLVPFRDIDEYFDRLFDLRRWPRLWPMERELSWQPATDISETEHEYVFKAELPEVKKEDVSVEVDGNVLTIKGERKAEKEEKNKKMHRVERFYGSFLRSFTLPENVNPKAITAELKDGVLTVHLPKAGKEQPRPTRIEVR
ncbi:MAG: Hsp20/alpha crystallin family protein [Sutterellaceae bacterium]|nr:Hsp20/alpha crystallin family protein [Burkholderiaceae bacterium]MCX7901765.1 Hsp20/alpha crystallin family protein [Burkholderiaceae bacterium]MDW8430349.1 Hsp20/alpha crystallin family protein [Sutterellaceae bacterium]